VSASMMPPEQFASLISDASDEQLAEGMASNREPILEEIFKRMPDQFDPAKAPDVTAVIEWQITGGPDGSTDRWQLAIKDGKCTCARGGASLTISRRRSSASLHSNLPPRAAFAALFHFARPP